MCQECERIVRKFDPKIIGALEKYSADLLNIFTKIDAEIGPLIIEFAASDDEPEKVMDPVEGEYLLRRQIITGLYASAYLHNMLPVENEALVVEMARTYLQEGLLHGHAFNYVRRKEPN